MKSIIISCLCVFSLKAFAHEGHNHDAPTTLKAPKGGLIKALDESRVEVVSKGKDIKIYVYDTELKPLMASRFQVKAVAELPRTKKSEDLMLKAQENFFEASYEAKGMHRYTLKLEVHDTKVNRSEKLTFVIEPKK